MSHKAILVDVIPPNLSKEEGLQRLDELESLVKTFGGIAVVKVIQKKSVPDYKTYIGSGKLKEILDENKTNKASLLIVNNLLKPMQNYNLNEICKKSGVEVWDRVDLILKIFDKHAKSVEAKLQIELAAIRHMGPRIYGMGLELGRQGGGIGTSGIGETNTEIMKRHLRERAREILDDIKQYSQVRKGHREARRRVGLKTVSIIGYTNAGKTSLLNALTKRKEYAADELFAT